MDKEEERLLHSRTKVRNLKGIKVPRDRNTSQLVFSGIKMKPLQSVGSGKEKVGMMLTESTVRYGKEEK